ncbi:efflux transporter outer membrane subunit [Comamonadaceae bacterium OH2545_COT-014]|nr:efflux transporter outer membrane subunit [Comamonadaceae bacterium OH2545_COT-014]
MTTTIRSPAPLPRLAALTLAATTLLAGCSLTPVYERPALPVAAQWPATAHAPAGADHATAPAVAAADLPWQQFVHDERLRELIAMALHGNRDLRVAVQAVAQARAQYQVRRADQAPTLNAGASATRSTPAPMAAFGGPEISSNYGLSVGLASWEIDFFGRVAALKDAALAQYLATNEARKAAQISVVAAVSQAWLALQTDTALLQLAERTLATREQSLQLIQMRVDHGVSSALDLRQAQSLAATARASRAQQQRLRAQDIHALTLLVGQAIPEHLLPPLPATQPAAAPADMTRPTPAPQATAALTRFAEVPAGLPSDLLLRRPDIRQAEQQLIAANANIGAARANFFPRISLTASLGRVSGDLDGLLGSGGSRAWTFAPSLVLPLFDMGRNRAALEAAQAAREMAVAQYEKAIQTAFKEVADALAARSALADQLGALEQQAHAEQERFGLADLRYRNGVASYLDMLDAQRSLFATEQALAQARLAQRVNEVQLYKALGGGWHDAAAENPPGAASARPASGG